jgi:hypothetical protein
MNIRNICALAITPPSMLIREPCPYHHRKILDHRHAIETVPYRCATIAILLRRIPEYTPFNIPQELCALIFEYVMDFDFVLALSPYSYPRLSPLDLHIKMNRRWINHLLNIGDLTLESYMLSIQDNTLHHATNYYSIVSPSNWI